MSNTHNSTYSKVFFPPSVVCFFIHFIWFHHHYHQHHHRHNKIFLFENKFNSFSHTEKFKKSSSVFIINQQCVHFVFHCIIALADLATVSILHQFGFQLFTFKKKAVLTKLYRRNEEKNHRDWISSTWIKKKHFVFVPFFGLREKNRKIRIIHRQNASIQLIVRVCLCLLISN